MELMQDKRDYILPEDAEKMFKSAQTEDIKLLLRLLWATGRRISEVVGERGITPGDIRVEEGAIMFNILKKKADVQKWKPVDPDVLADLKSYCSLKGIASGFKIWPKSRRWAYKVFHDTAVRAGVLAVNGRAPHPHSFRHSFAIRAVRVSTKPSDLRALQDLLDHSKLETTEVYIQFNPAEARALIDKMKGK